MYFWVKLIQTGVDGDGIPIRNGHVTVEADNREEAVTKFKTVQLPKGQVLGDYTHGPFGSLEEIQHNL